MEIWYRIYRGDGLMKVDP